MRNIIVTSVHKYIVIILFDHLPVPFSPPPSPLPLPQLDREVERLHQNLEDYRRQLESSTDRRLEVSNYRDLIGQREDEIRRQIDKIEVRHISLLLRHGFSNYIISPFQELVEERESLEKQLSQLTALLGQVEEKRLRAIKDAENMKV